MFCVRVRSGLIQMDWLSKSDPLVAVYIQNDGGDYDLIGKTEWIK
jgi:hypothetical protein